MKIRVSYGLCTDGDYSLRNPKRFGCIQRDVEIEEDFFDYVGTMDFESEKEWRCKHEVKIFLEKLLCDGFHISYTHYWLLEDFYNIIESLLNFIKENNSGELCKKLSGNYDGTYIKIKFI